MTLSPIRKLALASALTLGVALAAPAMAADPTVDQVYSAAKSGHVDDALSQMQQVLKDHPNSAKAHFIEAELLAKSGRSAEARTELAKAEQLKPGLPFASPRAVSALKQQLGTTATATSTRTEVVQQPQRESHGFPWMPVIVIGGLVFLLLAFLRRRSAANQAYAPPQPYGGEPYGSPGPQGGPFGGGYQQGGYPGGPGYGQPGYGQPGYGAPPPQQGGMGGGIMSSLAGGAAAGAGFAAGEAVIGRVFGDHDRERVVERDVPVQSAPDDHRNTNQDMGGDDFGISDSGSWDDGGSSGGSDDW